MKEKLFKVYIHTFPNHKCYIGITSSSLLHRWGDRGQGYANQRLMWRAIQRYGWENIAHSVIADRLSEEQACAMEIQLIKQYQSNNPKYGYNVAGGGHLQPPMSPEARKKQAQALRGRKLSLETRKKMSESRKGKKNPFYGKKLSQEARDRIREANKHRHISDSTREKLSKVHKGVSKTQEHKDKLSKSLMGHYVSPETRHKMSLAKKGKPSPRKGVKLSDETRKKLSEGHRGQIPWNKGKKLKS